MSCLEMHAAVIQHCLTISENETLSGEENSIFRKFVTIDPLLSIKQYSVETIAELRASIYEIQNTLEQTKNVGKVKLFLLNLQWDEKYEIG